jgi:DNA-3-methyladenine glycosylase II
MTIDFQKIHKTLLQKSKDLVFLKNQIQLNKAITIQNTKLDFFMYISKIIISQQISNKVAEKIWNEFCFNSKKKKLNFKVFSRKSHLLNALKITKISERKKAYIEGIYDSICEKRIIPDELNLQPDLKLKNQLESFSGIGPWTADNMLIFFFKRLNILPRDDLVIKKVISKITEKEGCEIDFCSLFTPFLSILSLHFWKMSKRIL